MGEVALQVEGVSKLYQLNHKSTSLRQLLSMGNTQKNQDFWALDNVSFELKKGDVLGVIGKNGAGKSTLLKILAQITPPTKGQVIIEGNINALLEVGTGFHPDLTGRENIFLNGGILGMKRSEIRQKFQQIIDFAEIEQFIDIPVKRYSSGMYMRLAFSIAIHLRFDILLLDEILAVGDTVFQKKCIDYIQKSIKSGKSVVVCSHNQFHLTNLCTRGLVLNNGKKVFEGSTKESLKYYAQINNQQKPVASAAHYTTLSDHPHKTYDSSQGMQAITLRCDGKPSSHMYAGCGFCFQIDFAYKEAFNYLVFGFVIKNSLGKELLGVNNLQLGSDLKPTKKHQGTINVEIPQLLLYKEDTYTLDLFFGDNQSVFDVIPDAATFYLSESDIYQSGILPQNSINQYFQPDLKIECIE